jgi:hypothetical protein
MRELTKKEELTIKSLRSLAKKWPNDLMLYSNSGTLCVIDSDTCEVIDVIGIPNDGGDAGSYIDDDGTEYIER